MMVSSRGRYALRVLLDLAQHREDGYVPMHVIAQRQGISKKYMEQIMPALTKGGLVDSVQGKRGGYRLCLLRVDAVSEHIIAHGAVQRTGIHIDKSQLPRQNTRNCAFPGAGRAVDRHGKRCFSVVQGNRLLCYCPTAAPTA